jgi:DNA-binding winged helix-turn-helix (wHTH) protein
MGTQPNPAPKVLFGPFEFEPGSGELRKFGNRIRLQGKPLQILAILLEQPGEVRSREELQRHLWQSTTFVDFEQGLNTAVNKLRQALGDAADQPRFIETVPGKGYRFIAPLQAEKPALGLKTVLEMAPPANLRIEPKPQKRPQPVMPWALAIGGVVLASGFWFATPRDEPAALAKPARFAIVSPAGFAFEAAASRQSFALSPDGTHLAFTAMDTSGAFSAFVRELNSLEPRLLPGSEGVHTLFWAPDSRSLYLTVEGKVLRAPLKGDARVVLGDSPGFLFSGAWLNPERLLLGTSMASYSIPPSGGSMETLKEQYRWPQLLPDGEHILSVAWDTRNNRFRARVARFNDPGSARDLIEADSRVLYTGSLVNRGTGYLIYLRAGNLLAQPFDPNFLRVTGEAMPVASKVTSFRPTGGADFSVSNSGTLAYQSFASRSQLVWVDREGRRLGTAGRANVNVKSGRLSPDGRKLAAAIYDIERGGQNLWIVDLETDAMRQLTLEPGIRDAPVWSPDSKTLGFLHNVVGRQPRVTIRGTGEGDAEEVLGQAGFQIPSGWSPDGRFIVFANAGVARLASEVQSDVMLLDLARGREVIPVLNTRFHEANAVFSPDGKWLTFTSNESGRPEVYVQAFDAQGTPRVTGDRHLVTRSGAQALRWRRDGKELFYLALDGRVYAIPAKLSPKPEFGPEVPLFAIALEARSAIHTVLGFDVSSDGKRFLIPAVDSQPGPSLVVMQNWEAALSQSRAASP